MSVAWSIAWREYRSFFRVPMGWVSIALYLFLSGSVFALSTLVPGQPASMRGFFGLSGFILLPVIPAVSMRLLSEEYRSGTIEPLMTSPAPDAAIVLGKYASGIMFLMTMLAPTLALVGILARSSAPTIDPGPIISGYASLLLVGALYLAIGTLASALTANQTLAFLAGFLAILALLLGTSDLVVSRPGLPDAIRGVLARLSLARRSDDFAKGVLSTGNIVYFLAGAGAFLTAAVLVVRSRRWR